MTRRLSSRRLTGLVTLALLVPLLGGYAVAVLRSPRAAASGPIIYTYEVRGLQNRSSLTPLAQLAAQTYADPRGWGLGGSIVFRRVASGGNFTLWLSAASRVPGFGSPCDSEYSCTSGRNVIINEDRWLDGSAAWNASGANLGLYRTMVINHETGHWLGFAHEFCGGAGQAAPVMQQQSISLQGCRPNSWPTAAERQRLASSRHVRIGTPLPYGSLDAVSAVFKGVRVSGWAVGRGTSAPIRVAIYIDGRGRSSTASRSRPDVARAHPGAGSAHGFVLTLAEPAGRHQVCVYAVAAAGHTGLGCRTVTVSGAPIGRLDIVRGAAGSVSAAGWALDPDTSKPIRVHVYVGRNAIAITAAASRPDVGRRYPGLGANHGFVTSVRATSGRNQVCAYAIDSTGVGHTLLGCRPVTVPAPVPG
ncbi:MAG: hypothetical protein JWN95_3465 [Frankiales bacterium]|nr:hypothetical protein [Frankiales bacterium]